MGEDSEKLKACGEWVENNSPDIVIFSEISFTIKDTATIGSLNRLKWVITLDVNGRESTKNLAVFAKASVRSGTSDVAYEKTGDTAMPLWRMVTEETELPFFESVKEERTARSLVVNPPKRKLPSITVEFQTGRYLHIYGLHANASYSGGKTALAAIDKFIANSVQTAKSSASSPIVAGGDFNCDSGRLTDGLTQKVAPLAYDGKELQFTQWNKDLRPASYIKGNRYYDEAEYKKYCAALHLTQDVLEGWTQSIKPGKQIDYVLCSKGLKIEAVKNCSSAAEWLGVLKQFDHAPVLYQV